MSEDSLQECCADAKKEPAMFLYSASYAIASWFLSLLRGCRRVHGYRWAA